MILFAVGNEGDLAMRGAFQDQTGLLSYISLPELVPEKHSLRDILELARAVLVDMNRDFAARNADEGRPSIPPEQLASALPPRAFHGPRPERPLIEQLDHKLDYNLLFFWFVGLSPDAPVWVQTTFTKNRDRLQEGEILPRFMQTLARTIRAPSGFCRTNIFLSMAR